MMCRIVQTPLRAFSRWFLCKGDTVLIQQKYRVIANSKQVMYATFGCPDTKISGKRYSKNFPFQFLLWNSRRAYFQEFSCKGANG